MRAPIPEMLVLNRWLAPSLALISAMLPSDPPASPVTGCRGGREDSSEMEMDSKRSSIDGFGAWCPFVGEDERVGGVSVEGEEIGEDEGESVGSGSWK
jgi:hypothetical protein